jgi:dihydrofolate reductase
MGLVVADITMSLDGFVADPADQVGPLFDWFSTGPVAYRFPGDDRPVHVSDASAGHLRQTVTSMGALVCGRRLFDFTGGWGGSHPAGVPVFVVTHSVPERWPHGTTPFTFVTDGVDSAVRQARTAAGEKAVSIASPSVTQQCLNAGLLDVIQVSLVPVLLGEGIPFFAQLSDTPILLEDPQVVEGTRVTHLYYRVRPDKPEPTSPAD